LDALTRQWDIYPKEEDNSYILVNLHNFHLVFTHKQIVVPLRAIIFTMPILHATTIIDQEQLHSDILAVLSLNLSVSNQQAYLEGHWLIDNTSFL